MRLADSLPFVNCIQLTGGHSFSLIIVMVKRNEIYTDYHTHSTFSVDAQDTIEAMCRKALSLGLTEIAITDHAEWHPAYRGKLDVERYFRELERCRDKFAPSGLAVLSGVEMGNPHEYSRQAAPLVQNHSFDVRVASLHWLYGENIHDAACFVRREPLEVYADYFTALGHMAADFSDIDIVAHFDRILWRGTLIGAPFSLVALENVIRDALATIAWRGLALELNTRLLTHAPHWHEELATMLRWFREEGGRRVVVNSDAHRTGHLGTNLEIACRILDDAGLAPDRLTADQTQPEPVI